MINQAIIIELAEQRDALVLSQMTRDEIETGFGWNYRIDRIKALMKEHETVVLVARSTQTQAQSPYSDIAGFGVMKYGVKDAHLLLLAAAPMYRRQGIAGRLLAWLERTARYAGIQSVNLEVRENNASAVAFYLSLGYIKQKLIANYYRSPDGSSEHAWRMVKNLATNKALEV